MDCKLFSSIFANHYILYIVLVCFVKTLRDLIGADEIKQISQTNLSNEELKRRKLEEEIQREREERLRKRQELMKKENEYEQVQKS